MLRLHDTLSRTASATSSRPKAVIPRAS